MPRNTYLVCYDICDDKRLRQVFRTLRDFGTHLVKELPRSGQQVGRSV